MTETWLDFHVRPNTPKQRHEMIVLRDSFLTEGVRSRIIIRQGRTREAVVLQTSARDHSKVKEMGIV